MADGDEGNLLTRIATSARERFNELRKRGRHNLDSARLELHGATERFSAIQRILDPLSPADRQAVERLSTNRHATLESTAYKLALSDAGRSEKPELYKEALRRSVRPNEVVETTKLSPIVTAQPGIHTTNVPPPPFPEAASPASEIRTKTPPPPFPEATPPVEHNLPPVQYVTPEWLRPVTPKPIITVAPESVPLSAPPQVAEPFTATTPIPEPSASSTHPPLAHEAPNAAPHTPPVPAEPHIPASGTTASEAIATETAVKEGNWIMRIGRLALRGIHNHKAMAIALPAVVAVTALLIPNKQKEGQEQDGNTESKWGAGKKTLVFGAVATTVGTTLNAVSGPTKGWIGRVAEAGLKAAEHGI